MNSYINYDRAEDAAWDRYYSRIDYDDSVSKLAQELENILKPCHFESMVKEKLKSHLENIKAISESFNDDCDFQEKLSEFIVYMSEAIARRHVNINIEGK
ncbi:host-nuclease inhibitor Gam family protein [Enterobacteriaceae bacterium ESL0689]|nr:host-nuclease inhibitor Gam family protein [Enterobacteriaceae bacterium ESL0689]